MSAFADAVYVLDLRECLRQNAYSRLAKVRRRFIVGNGIGVTLGSRMSRNELSTGRT
jgi:hypothetical protein